MPIYNYKCSHCSDIIELTKKIDNRDNTESDICPHCNNTSTLNRIMAMPLIAYSISVNGGYGSKVPSDFRDILKRAHSVPGARQNSSYL